MAGFRVVVIKERCKLDLRSNRIFYRGEQEKFIVISEVFMLIIESTGVSITSALLSELIKNDVAIIFCDEKHNPESELLPLYGSYDCPAKLNEQLNWEKYVCERVWTEIVKNKIKQQSRHLFDSGHIDEATQLLKYESEVELFDATNREGFSAKVYFDALNGQDFCRRNDCDLNGMLNYGYAILLSCFNREIVADGFLTQLGIWHKGSSNQFNLSCDLMEPFRVVVDRVVEKIDKKQNFKQAILNGIFSTKLVIGGKKEDFDKAISIYCHSVFYALKSGDFSKILFFEYEL